jgi:hypothetical protein
VLVAIGGLVVGLYVRPVIGPYEEIMTGGCDVIGANIIIYVYAHPCHITPPGYITGQFSSLFKSAGKLGVVGTHL